MSDSQSTPRVSVIIPGYRAPEHLNQALASVARQSFGDFEIIVVDDGSGGDVVAQYRLPDRARLLRRPQSHGGAAAARNEGIRAARGAFLALLDQDDLWLPEKLERQLASLEEHPEAGLTSCHFTKVDASLQPLPEQRPFAPPEKDPVRHLLRGHGFGAVSSLLLRREVFDACGLFDETLFCVSDWDMSLRIAHRFVCHYDPTPMVLRRLHAGQVSWRHLPMRKGDVAVMLKTVRWLAQERPDLLPLARRRLANALRRLAKYSLGEGGDPREALQAVARAIRTCPWEVRSYATGAAALLRLARPRRGAAVANHSIGELLCK